MAIDKDITCLYAAKEFETFLEVNPPPIPKERNLDILKGMLTQAYMKPLTWGLTAVCYMEDMADNLKYHTEKVEDEEEMSKRGGFKGWLRDTFIDEPRERRESKKREKENLEELAKSADDMDAKFLGELREYGLSEEKGLDAWTVAHFAGLCISNYTRLHDEESPRITERELDSLLYTGVADGVMCLESRYWVNGDVIPAIVNPDFYEKAHGWLKDEMHSRLNSGEEFILLDAVKLRKDGDDIVLGFHYRDFEL